MRRVAVREVEKVVGRKFDYVDIKKNYWSCKFVCWNVEEVLKEVESKLEKANIKVLKVKKSNNIGRYRGVRVWIERKEG